MEIKEIWRDIKGYEGIYQVSNLGNVKSLQRVCKANTKGERVVKQRILSFCKSKNGYYTVILSKNGKHKTFSIHRIVANTFLPNPQNKKEVNHKDENKLNNSLDNLEWCDRKYNANYGTGTQRCLEQKYKPVCMIDTFLNKPIRTFKSAKDAEEKTGISRKLISYAILNKKISKGYRWEFV